MAAVGTAGRPTLAWLWCLLISFVVRASLCLVVVQADVPPIYDEGGYLSRAEGFYQILGSLARGEAPTRPALSRAYGRGVWPPAQPLVLGIAMAVAGQSPGAARGAMVVLGALTTLIVYFVTRRLAGPRGALAAAALHALYPSFVAFSHYLFSETTFFFFLLIAVGASMALPWQERRWKRAVLAGLGGATIALAALTRTAALPLLAVFPLWLCFVLKGTRARLAYPCLMAVVMVATLAPWQLALLKREGRFVMLTSVTGYYLLADNDPWDSSSVKRLKQRLRQNAKRLQTNQDAAARKLLLEQIREHPAKYLARCVKRFRQLWRSDVYVLRHILAAVYPPLPAAVAWLLVLLLQVSYLALVGLACLGLLAAGPSARDKGLLLVAGAASALPPVLTFANTRMSLPVLALMLPLAGHGVAALAGAGSRRWQLGLAFAVVAANVLNMTTLPRSTYFSSQASSFYRSILARVDDQLGSRSRLGDCLALRSGEDLGDVFVRLDKGYAKTPRRRRPARWATGERPVVRLDVFSHPQPRPLTLWLTVEQSGERVELQPIDATAWRQWRPTGLAGIEMQWCGGSLVRRIAVQ